MEYNPTRSLAPIAKGHSSMHEIFGERFVSVRESAWHRLGTVIDEPVATSEALQLARALYDVSSRPLLFSDGRESGYSAVVRGAVDDDPQDRVLGVAKSYDLVHISDVDFDSVKFPVDTVGVLRQGAEIFISYKLGDREILGEDYEMYLTVIHPYAPGVSWKVMLTPVRVVCANTLVLGATRAQSTIAVSHNAGAKKRIDSAMLVAQAEALEMNALKRLERMNAIRMSSDDIDRVLDRTYGVRQSHHAAEFATSGESAAVEAAELAAKAYQYYTKRSDEVKETVKLVIDRFNDEHSKYANTGYAVYNAIVEYEDYHLGPRAKESRAAELAIAGGRANNKKKAAAAILQLN